ELMPLVEQYDKAHSELTRLNDQLPEQLKKSILQEAIQGKLVPQDPTAEPASELLERIRTEKAQLIKEGKIKKGQPTSHIYRDDEGSYYEKVGSKDPVCINHEIPFDLPPSWEWCRLGDIITIKGGKRVPNGYKLLDRPTPHIYIRVSDMKDGSISASDLKYIDDAVYETIKSYTIGKDDLYLTIAGTIGRVGVVPFMFDNMNLTENAVKLTNILSNKMFLFYAISSYWIQSQFNRRTNQVAQPKLAIIRINSTLIPLPPLEEQKRIVARIEELMPRIDKLR
ncbi:restriction endonuclease subunit S, partial [Porphyromonas somerae]|uniref:restriction endonuclease subunit S n=1 Tax=Porphyromonas somerae TaxID=322095 RepID=UPI002A75C962